MDRKEINKRIDKLTKRGMSSMSRLFNTVVGLAVLILVFWMGMHAEEWWTKVTQVTDCIK